MHRLNLILPFPFHMHAVLIPTLAAFVPEKYVAVRLLDGDVDYPKQLNAYLLFSMVIVPLDHDRPRTRAT